MFALPLFVENISGIILEFLEVLPPKTAPGTSIAFLLLRKCATGKKLATCGNCSEMDKYETLGTVTSNNVQALENLKSNR